MICPLCLKRVDLLCEVEEPLNIASTCSAWFVKIQLIEYKHVVVVDFEQGPIGPSLLFGISSSFRTLPNSRSSDSIFRTNHVLVEHSLAMAEIFGARHSLHVVSHTQKQLQPSSYIPGMFQKDMLRRSR